MNKSDSYNSKLSQARGLASQLGMFAEENDIPKDLWDSLEATIYDFYEVSHAVSYTHLTLPTTD